VVGRKPGERAGPDPFPTNTLVPLLPRNLSQGRLAPVVPAEDGTIPQCQRAELPHQVCQLGIAGYRRGACLVSGEHRADRPHPKPQGRRRLLPSF
jgi:hypothetical protein